MANVTLGGDDPADLTISVSNRSSNDGCLEALVAIHESTGRLFSAPESLQIEVDGGLDGRYPAWQPNGASKLLAAAEEVYAKTFGPGYDATIIHAGLECGYAVQKYEKTDQPMDCISIGPTIQNPHTVNERLKLSTVEPFYDAVKALVKQLCNP